MDKWIENTDRTAMMNSNLATFDRNVGGFLLMLPAMGAAGALSTVVPAWAATTYGGGRIVYYGTSATLGGGSGWSLGWLRDTTFGLERTTGSQVTDVMGGALLPTILTPMRLGGMSPLARTTFTATTGAAVSGLSEWTGESVDISLAGQGSHDWNKIGWYSVIGAGSTTLAGSFDTRVRGWSAGPNNNLSTFEGVYTRITNGYASRYSVLTATKGASGQFVQSSGGTVAATVVEGIAKKPIEGNHPH